MANVKKIAAESIPHSIEKAERYRLLNQPFLAESICLDVLALDAEHQQALAVYVLALGDQIADGLDGAMHRARVAIERLKSGYERFYYSGILEERRAMGILKRGGFGAGGVAWRHIHEAMDFYEKAESVQKDHTVDDAILRYNTCVRLIEAHRLTEPPPDRYEYPLE